MLLPTFFKKTVSELALCFLYTAGYVLAASSAPGQPNQAMQVNAFELVGNSIASGQQVHQLAGRYLTRLD
jgi:hypothetical protein